MPLRTDPKTLVLAALTDGPCHGYALLKAIRETLGARVRIDSGQIYAALRALEAEGYVISEWEPNKPDRRTYRITEDGTRQLAWRAEEWYDVADAVARLLPPRGTLL